MTKPCYWDDGIRTPTSIHRDSPRPHARYVSSSSTCALTPLHKHLPSFSARPGDSRQGRLVFGCGSFSNTVNTYACPGLYALACPGVGPAQSYIHINNLTRLQWMDGPPWEGRRQQGRGGGRGSSREISNSNNSVKPVQTDRHFKQHPHLPCFGRRDGRHIVAVRDIG